MNFDQRQKRLAELRDEIQRLERDDYYEAHPEERAYDRLELGRDVASESRHECHQGCNPDNCAVEARAAEDEGRQYARRRRVGVP